MASSINASTSAGVVTTADTSGVLNIQTANTTAISISASQVVSYTNNPTYSGGTANGVLYLNGSKVATSGSGLVFDGVDLGVGATPSSWSVGKAVEVGFAGSSLWGNTQDTTYLTSNAYFNSGWKYAGTGKAGTYVISAGAHNWNVSNTSGTAGGALSLTSAMTLDATGNLGIGTSSPAYKLHVSNYMGLGTQASSGAGAGINMIPSSTLTNWFVGANYVNPGAFEIIPSTAGGGSTFSTPAFVLNSSGNLGLGVTPSAWSLGKAFEIGNTGNGVWGVGSGDVVMFEGGYYNSGWKYAANSVAAARYEMNAGVHQWYNAPSGTAGNAITFTQAMTLDASGRLLVGTTTAGANGASVTVYDSSQSEIRLQNSTTGTGTSVGFQLAASGNTAYLWNVSNGPMVFSTNSAERARIDSSGNFLVGTTTAKSTVTVQGQLCVGQTGSASNAAGIYLYANDALSDNSFLCRVSNGTGTTTWYIGNQAITTSSDIRLKDNIKPTERNAVELLSQWEIIDHTWNDPSDQCENNRNSRGVWTGVSAQQVQQVTPWLVNKPTEDTNEDGSINPWTMDFGYAVPLLVKAIQEQQALIQTLTARIEALEGAK